MTDLNEAAKADEGLTRAILSYRQADAEGIMVIVSRQACEEAASRIAALSAEVERVTGERDEVVARAQAKADYEAERAGDIENEFDAMKARTEAAEAQVAALINAWETLLEGNHPAATVGAWLRDHMGPAINAARAWQASRGEVRPCTCHPDDNPPVPCAEKFALSECRAASARAAVPVDRLPTRKEAALAASLLLRCNGHDLTTWGAEDILDDPAIDALKALAAPASPEQGGR